MSGSQNTDEKYLLDELRTGNSSAFEHIFRSYWKPLYAIARSKLLSHDEAEEVIQVVFSKLWEMRERLQIENLSSYLYTAVKNRIINDIRARLTRERYWEYYRKFIPPDQHTTEDLVSFEEMNRALESAVSKLPEKSRIVFKLSRFEGRSNAEIADILQLSEKAIEYHITKSVKELKIYLKDYISVVLLLISAL